jgi:cell division protein FtsA
MAKEYPTVAAIDFGTSKIAVLICEINPSGLEAVGFGQRESHGIRKGMIVNIDSTVMALQEAVDEAKALAGREIDFVIAGVTGSHVQAVGSNGMVPIRGKDVDATDIQKVIEAASAVNMPLDREIIQVVPEEFIIDGQEGIHDPFGMYGKRLEVRLQIISGAVTPLENLRRCLQKVDLKLTQFVSNPLASARAVLNQAERDAGVCVVDIGATSTDLCVYHDGAFRWLRSLPIGGMHLTNDLAVGLKTNLTEAQRLKHNYGAVVSEFYEEEIEIAGLADLEPRRIHRRMLSTILQPRLDEIFTLVKNELAAHGVDESLPSGVVITGGASTLKGLLLI